MTRKGLGGGDGMSNADKAKLNNAFDSIERL